MNSRERVFASARGELTDCFAVTPYNGNFSIRFSGYKLGECYTDGKKLADAQYRAWEEFGQDVIVAQSDQFYMLEGLGLKTKHHEDALPEVIGRPIGSIEEAERLEPLDPYKDGRAYVYIEAVGLLAQRVKGQAAVRAPGAGAYTMAGNMLGITDFLTAMALAEMEEDEEKIGMIMRLIEVMYESHYRFCEACVKAGADIVQSADSMASLDLTSPALYEKYAKPFEKRFFERISKLKAEHEFLTLLHICGNNTKIAHLLTDVGCDILEVDYKVDLAHFKELLGGHICLMGNLNPAGALLQGRPQDVEQEALSAISKAGYGGRFLLGSGCELSANTPAENVRCMVETGHRAVPRPGEAM